MLRSLVHLLSPFICFFEKNINLVQVATQKHKRILKKSKKKGKIFHKKDDIPLLSILSIGTIPYLMIPRPSIANVTDLDPDCACSAGVSYKNYYKGINSKSSMDIMEKKYNFEERLAEETEENDDGESNIFPIQLINAEDINETYCRCQCFCDNFELFAVFRNVTNGNWSNNENVGVPDKISNMEPNCGCIDVGPYIVSALPEETINLTPSSSPTK